MNKIPNRRQVLATLGGAISTSIAGCSLMSSPEPVEGRWPMQGRTAGHVSATDEALPDGANERWRTTLTGQLSATPAIRDNRLVVAGGETVYALDAASGTKQWETTVSAVVQRSAAFVDGLVVVAASDGIVHALQGSSGEPVWTFDTGASQLRAAPTVHNGTIYVAGGGETGPVAALASTDGSVEWTSQVGGSVASAVAVHDDTAYAAIADGTTGLVALDAASGNEQWRYAAESALYTPVVHDGTVYLPAADGLAAVASDGTEQWRRGDATANGSVSVAGGQGYYRIGGGTLRAVALGDGATVWERGVGGELTSTPVTGADGVVLPTTTSLYGLACYEKTTGEERWRSASDERYGGVSVVDGHLFTGTVSYNDDESSLVAFEP